jgi:hypothetical protein
MADIPFILSSTLPVLFSNQNISRLDLPPGYEATDVLLVYCNKNIFKTITHVEYGKLSYIPGGYFYAVTNACLQLPMHVEIKLPRCAVKKRYSILCLRNWSATISSKFVQILIKWTYTRVCI